MFLIAQVREFPDAATNNDHFDSCLDKELQVFFQTFQVDGDLSLLLDHGRDCENDDPFNRQTRPVMHVFAV
jgi:hypothetical protein